MSVYYNEIDSYCAEWLRNLMREKLIPEGDVDERSIADVDPADLLGFTTCHFFAGLGGWAYALRLAGWPDDRPVWTGSCPCQPFSAAGKRKGFADERHLWPFFCNLIRERRPAIVFGEQVASASQWLRLVRSDLETLEYAVGTMPIQAASAGAFHPRERFFFVADTQGEGRCGRQTMAGRRRAESGRPSEDVRAFARPLRTGNGATIDVSDVLRPSYGIPARVAKLRAIGNAIDSRPAVEFIAAADDAMNDAEMFS